VFHQRGRESVQQSHLEKANSTLSAQWTAINSIAAKIGCTINTPQK
jgi:hypothetical protein